MTLIRLLFWCCLSFWAAYGFGVWGIAIEAYPIEIILGVMYFAFAGPLTSLFVLPGLHKVEEPLEWLLILFLLAAAAAQFLLPTFDPPLALDSPLGTLLLPLIILGVWALRLFTIDHMQFMKSRHQDQRKR